MKILSHFKRLQTIIALMLVSAWYIHLYPPQPDAEPSRIYIALNVTWKLCLGWILFHIGRHEMFGYIRLGEWVEKFRAVIEAAIRDNPAQAAIAIAIIVHAFCYLIANLFGPVVTVMAKY